MANNEVKDEKTAVLLVRPFGPSFADVEEKIKNSSSLTAVACADANEVAMVCKSQSVAIILVYATNTNDLALVLAIIRKLDARVNLKKYRIVLTTLIDEPSILEKMLNTGVYDVVPAPANAKSLFFKIERMAKQMRNLQKTDETKVTGNRKKVQDEASVKKKSATPPPAETIIWTPPLELASDCWFQTTAPRKIGGRWAILLGGPSPADGRWQAEGDIFRWVPQVGRGDDTTASKDGFIRDEGSWVFRGQEPRIQSDAWVFVGKTPDLSFFRGPEQIACRFSTRPETQQLTMSKNSVKGQELERRLEDSWRKLYQQRDRDKKTDESSEKAAARNLVMGDESEVSETETSAVTSAAELELHYSAREEQALEKEAKIGAEKTIADLEITTEEARDTGARADFVDEVEERAARDLHTSTDPTETDNRKFASEVADEDPGSGQSNTPASAEISKDHAGIKSATSINRSHSATDAKRPNTNQSSSSDPRARKAPAPPFNLQDALEKRRIEVEKRERVENKAREAEHKSIQREVEKRARDAESARKEEAKEKEKVLAALQAEGRNSPTNKTQTIDLRKELTKREAELIEKEQAVKKAESGLAEREEKAPQAAGASALDEKLEEKAPPREVHDRPKSFSKGTAETPSLNPLALAFLLSELMSRGIRHPALSPQELANTFCNFLGYACGETRVQLWLSDQTCLGANDAKVDGNSYPDGQSGQLQANEWGAIYFEAPVSVAYAQSALDVITGFLKAQKTSAQKIAA